ncbi:MAG TPA: hypothetical protein VH519_05565 [Hyphomicrobiaceae bacterium]|jgi:hypothetical protein
MKLVETVIADTFVRIRLADDEDPLKAQSWIECRLPKAALVRASRTPVVGFDRLALPAARQSVLETMRAAIDDEIARLRSP